MKYAFGNYNDSGEIYKYMNPNSSYMWWGLSKRLWAKGLSTTFNTRRAMAAEAGVTLIDVPDTLVLLHGAPVD